MTLKELEEEYNAPKPTVECCETKPTTVETYPNKPVSGIGYDDDARMILAYNEKTKTCEYMMVTEDGRLIPVEEWW